MMEEWAARALSLLASVAILIFAEPRINLMSVATRPGFRFALLTLSLGAACSILEILAGVVPSWPAVILRVGIAALLLEERHCPRTCTRHGAPPK